MSVISLLSTDPPNTDSPANLDAAKEVRENISGKFIAINARDIANLL